MQELPAPPTGELTLTQEVISREQMDALHTEALAIDGIMRTAPALRRARMALDVDEVAVAARTITGVAVISDFERASNAVNEQLDAFLALHPELAVDPDKIDFPTPKAVEKEERKIYYSIK